MALHCDDSPHTSSLQTLAHFPLKKVVHQCIIPYFNQHSLKLDEVHLTNYFNYLLNNKDQITTKIVNDLQKPLENLISKFDWASNMWLDSIELNHYSELINVINVLKFTNFSEKIIKTVSRIIKIQRTQQIDETIMVPFYNFLQSNIRSITADFSLHDPSAYEQSYIIADELIKLMISCRENKYCDISLLQEAFSILIVK